MPAWNLPHWLMNLAGVTGLGSVLAAGAALRGRHTLPLPLTAALAHAAAAGAAVSLCSARPLARRCIGVAGKDFGTGHIAWGPYLLLYPYHLGVLAAYWLYHLTSGEERVTRLADWLFLGGWPESQGELPGGGGEVALLDVTNELHAKVSGAAYKCVPSWETHGLSPADMEQGVAWALQQRQRGRLVLVYCTHGHGRSAAMAAALLIAAGEAPDPDSALRRIKQQRPGASPNARQVEQLREWAAARRGSGGGSKEK